MTLSLASFTPSKCDKIFLWTKACAVKKQNLSMDNSTFLNFCTSRRQYSDWLLVGRSGDRIPMATRYSTHF